jgi:hypothetical protein
VLSPVLSNIYLDRLDRYVETSLVPQYTRGTLRRHNAEYVQVQAAAAKARQRGDRRLARRLGQQQRNLPSRDPHDPDYRRLRYIRYADDHLLGFTGPKAEAEAIKQRLAMFLREDLKLELSEDKTLITHARTGAARFLGYEITVQHNDTKRTTGRRTANGTIALRVPRSVIKAKQAPYRTLGKPECQPRLMNRDDYTIISSYGVEYRGIVQYYLLAGDVWRLYRLHWVMLTSMLKTLAAKHRTTVTKMARTYKAVIATPHGPRTCFQASVQRAGRKPLVARFGGIPLQRQKTAVLADRQPIPTTPPPQRYGAGTPAPGGPLRTLRATSQCAGAPGSQPRRARQAGTATARVGSTHGATATQDTRGLPALPRHHPRAANNRDMHGVVTGEPR